MQSEESRFWQQYREEQKQRRADRLPDRKAEIEALSPLVNVEKKTDYQYRINDTLDLYPIHRRFHNIKTGKRGNYTRYLDKLLKQQKIIE